MATLTLERRVNPDDIRWFSEKLCDGYGITIIFSDETHIELSYVVPKQYDRNDSDPFTIDYKEFIMAYRNKDISHYGRIWHDYCADNHFRTINGKIGIYIHDCAIKPTIELSPKLAEQLISELERIHSS